MVFIGTTGLPAVREKSGKKIFFQGQGKVRELHQKSGNFVIIGNGLEKSGNFTKSQGIL